MCLLLFIKIPYRFVFWKMDVTQLFKPTARKAQNEPGIL